MKLAKSVVKACSSALGLEIRRAPGRAVSSADPRYTSVRPIAQYSPWNVDVAFREVYAKVRSHTLVDEYRCYELWKLVEQSAKLRGGAILEVGVWRGGTGALLARQAANCAIAEPVYLADTFRGVVKAGPRDASYTGGEHGDTNRAVVEELLSQVLGRRNVRILEGVFPDETGQAIAHERFRLCHVDVDAYESAKDILAWVWERMVPGGMVVYDDYGFQSCNGIAAHVDEQTALPDRLIIHNLNGHAILIKL